MGSLSSVILHIILWGWGAVGRTKFLCSKYVPASVLGTGGSSDPDGAATCPQDAYVLRELEDKAGALEPRRTERGLGKGRNSAGRGSEVPRCGLQFLKWELRVMEKVTLGQRLPWGKETGG